MYNNIKSHDRLGPVLFYCIVLSLLPILISHGDSKYIILVGVFSVLQYLILLFYYSPHFIFGINKTLLLFSLIFMISQTFTLLFTSFSNNIEINNFDFINIFVRFITILLFVCIPMQFSISQKSLEKFMFGIVFLGIVACIYNIIVNFDGLLNITSINNSYEATFKSFFPNRNIFGQLLLFCIIANTYLFIKKSSLIYLFNYLILGLNLFTSFSRTAIASASIFLLLLLIYYLKRRFLLTLFISFFVIIISTIIISNENISVFLTNNLFRLENGTSGRTALWELGFQILKESNLIFGVGYLTGVNILNKLGLPEQFHSFYIETLVGGGIIDLILHFVLILFIIEKIYKIYKKEQITGYIFFSAYIAFLFYAFFESASFFSMGYVDSLFRIFLITIPLLYANNVK